jgi:proteasome accessory factor B
MSARRTERLLNLVFVLTNAARPLPKARLHELVYHDSASTEAFERMFERDKEELRGMGVPIETVALDALSDEEQGYRLTADWRLPEVEFSVAELSVLAVAATAWENGCLAPAATTALRKLEAAGDAWAQPGLPVSPRVATGDPAFPVILAAVNSRREVVFEYRRADGQISHRRVHPFGLVQRHGRWYLAGADLERGSDRVFRLSRFVSAPRAVGPAGTFEVPADLRLDRFATQLSQEPATESAELLITPGACQELRRRATSVDSDQDGDRVVIDFRDTRSFSAALAAYGAAVQVLSPDHLRDAVIGRLRAAAAEASE